MNQEEWDDLKHFKSTENWGDPRLMRASFMQTLDSFRDNLDDTMIVTCGTQGKHVRNSAHYKGLAQT